MRYATNCDTTVEGVVFNRDSQHHCTDIGDLRRDRETQRNRNECCGYNSSPARCLSSLDWNL